MGHRLNCIFLPISTRPHKYNFSDEIILGAAGFCKHMYIYIRMCVFRIIYSEREAYNMFRFGKTAIHVML